MNRRFPLAVAVLALAAAAASAGGLDGTEWRLKYRNADSWLPVWKADVIEFDKGLFRSRECGSYGFQDGVYGAKRKRWTSTLYNEDGEKAEWQGSMLAEDRMEGTFIWTAPDGTVRRFKFEGRRRGESRAPGRAAAQERPSKAS